MTDLRAEGPLAPRTQNAPQATTTKPTKQKKRRRSGVGRLVRFLSAVTITAAVTAGAGGYAAWTHFSADLPDYAGLHDYQPAVMSRVYAGDSRLLAELATERRIFVPVDAMPDLVRRAFVSAEDQNFYQHNGVDPLAIIRAAITNLQQWGQGRRPIGASTITQQVAKNMLLDSEVSLSRKAREAILAMRIEQALPKDRILELYLNEIYLGFQAYGVAAAAQAYFNKSLDELSLSQVAFLAALPKAPNNYNPFRFPEAAKGRRDWVIDRMADDRVVTREQAEAAKAEPLDVVPFRRPDMVADSGYFAEEVRRQLIERFGPDRTTQGGLLVRTSLDPVMQAQADAALRNGLMGYDRRKGGWRGPVSRIDSPALATEWMAKLVDIARPGGMLPDWKLAVVLEVGASEAKLGWLERPPGRSIAAPQPQVTVMQLSDLTWARPRQNGRLGAQPRRVADVLAPGDVVMTELVPAQAARAAQRGVAARPARPERLLLRQIPEVEGAVAALDPATGRVLALSGGWSFDKSQFNRVTQAQRQPGSSFKPFVYMAAIESGVSMAEQMLDAPFVIDLGPGGGKWRPNNYSMNFNGMVPLTSAIARSLNLVTVRLADRVGLDRVAEVAERFGIVHDMPRVFPAALGAVETTVLRMAGGYAAFINGGKQVTPSVIDSVQDRDGAVIWRAPGRDCDGCGAGPDAPPVLADVRQQLTDPANAHAMTVLLQGVVAGGTGGRAGAGLGRPVAGKTGTTNDYLDAWFVGFTPDLVVAVWVGFDTPTPLGRDEGGGALAAPIFRDFMAAAMQGKPVLQFRPPPGVEWTGWPEPAPPGATTVSGEDGEPGDQQLPVPGSSVDSDLGGLY